MCIITQIRVKVIHEMRKKCLGRSLIKALKVDELMIDANSQPTIRQNKP